MFKLINKKILLGLAVASILALPMSLSAASLQVPSIGIKSIAEAMLKTRIGDTVILEKGVYREHVLLAPGVTLMSLTPHAAIVDGTGKGTVITMGKNSTIQGLTVRDGTIGVFSNSTGNTIISCKIIKNWQTGIIAVRHLPKIEDNIIAFNKGSGFQGWDVRSTSATLNHNTISYNGNHGVAVGGGSEFIMENNVIAFNERFGIKILKEAEKVQVTNNNFYRNLKNMLNDLPSGNFSFDPAFIAPRAGLNFSTNPAQCCKAKGTDDQELGSRVR